MSKRKILAKKPIRSATSDATVKVVTVTGAKRARVNPGLSEEALSKIDRFKAAGLRAEQRLGMIRLS